MRTCSVPFSSPEIPALLVNEETPKKTKKKVPITSAPTVFQFVFSNMLSNGLLGLAFNTYLRVIIYDSNC